MEWKQLLDMRESCRVYQTEPVARETLEQLVEAACQSPSGCNAQPWRFLIVDEMEAKARLVEAFDDDGLTGCPWGGSVPAFVVLCEQKATLQPQVAARYESQRFAKMDIGMAAMTLCYAATDHGLGSCIIGTFHEGKLKAALGIPEEATPRLVIALGYDAIGKPPRKKIRKPIDEAIGYNRW